MYVFGADIFSRTNEMIGKKNENLYNKNSKKIFLNMIHNAIGIKVYILIPHTVSQKNEK